MMPENHNERDEFHPDDEFYPDDDDDGYETDEARPAWPASGYPPSGFPAPPGRRPARRGWALAVTALVAAAFAFGVADVAVHGVSGSPAASATPSASAPGAGSSGGEPSPQDGGAPSLPSGAMMQLEIGGPVTAVSASSITIGSGDRAVTAAVTSATKITGKVTSIGGIKVGDLVSASVSGTAGKLVADSIQDPASLPSGPGQ